MLTLPEMQKSSIVQLRAIAADTDNRQYAIACEQMAHAMEAHQMGDTKARDTHIERAKVAYKRAQEDEHGQLNRVRAVQAVVDGRDAALDATVAGGKSVSKLVREKGVSFWNKDWIVR